MDEIAQKELGIDLDHLARVNVKGKLLFYTDAGEEHTYSLKEAHGFTRPGCLHCPDFAAEHADISFGGLGQGGPSWTLTVVSGRSAGVNIWKAAHLPTVSWKATGHRRPEGRRADVQAGREVPPALAPLTSRDSRRPPADPGLLPEPALEPAVTPLVIRRPPMP